MFNKEKLTVCQLIYLEVVSPEWSDLVLTANVPHGEADVFVLDRLNVEPYIKQEYRNNLKSGLVRYTNGRFVSSCQTVRYPNGGLKTGLKKPVYGPKCLVLKCSAKPHDFAI